MEQHSTNDAVSSSASSSSFSSSPLLYDLTLVSPWFELTRDGHKTYEGRIAWKQSRFYKSGDILRIHHASDATQPPFFSRVLEIHQFASFEDGLAVIPLKSALPNVDSIQAGVEIYQQFYSIDAQRSNGILFIRTERVMDEADISLVPLAVRRISLWLQSSTDDESFRSQSRMIDSLSSTHSQPTFAPHITLGGFPWPHGSEWSIEELVRRLQRAVSISTARGPFHVEFENLAVHPIARFMVLFQMIRRSPDLLSLRQAVWNELITPLSELESSQSNVAPLAPSDWQAPWPFVPHLSLLYDRFEQITPIERLKILEVAQQTFDPSFKRMKYRLDTLQLVLIDTNDYSQRWKVVGEINLNQLPSSSSSSSSSLRGETDETVAPSPDANGTTTTTATPPAATGDGVSAEVTDARRLRALRKQEKLNKAIREQQKAASDTNTLDSKRRGDHDSDSNSDSGASDDEDSDDDTRDHGEAIQKKDATTVRNLRIREDTAKYLLNLNLNSAHYDPKTRSMSDNPHSNKDPNDVMYAGDNFIRSQGEIKDIQQLQSLVLESAERGNEGVHVQASPSQAEKLFQEYKAKKEQLAQARKNAALEKYATPAATATSMTMQQPPRELLVPTNDSYLEHDGTGQVVKGQEIAMPKTKYLEDVTSAQSSSTTVSAPPDAILPPYSNEQAFREQVLNRLNKEMFMRLAKQLAASNTSITATEPTSSTHIDVTTTTAFLPNSGSVALLLVIDGQIIAHQIGSNVNEVAHLLAQSTPVHNLSDQRRTTSVVFASHRVDEASRQLLCGVGLHTLLFDDPS